MKIVIELSDLELSRVKTIVGIALSGIGTGLIRLQHDSLRNEYYDAFNALVKQLQ